MRRTGLIFTIGVLVATLALPAFAGDDPSSAPISCGNGVPGGINCLVSKKGLKEAHSAFREGVKLQEHQQLEQALERFDEASRLAPQNMQFLRAREIVKARLVFDHVQRGNLLLYENSRVSGGRGISFSPRSRRARPVRAGKTCGSHSRIGHAAASHLARRPGRFRRNSP